MWCPSKPLRSCAMTASLTMACLALSPVASAQEREGFSPEHRHHFSVIFAGTSLVDEDETGFTLGGDYEYRINKNFGTGIVLERAFGTVDATTLLAVVDLHVWRDLIIQVGPGVEFTEDETVVAGRLGAVYEFELPQNVTLSPQVHYDISREDAIVFGVAVGRAF